MRKIQVIVGAALAVLGGAAASAEDIARQPAQAWEIGPVIRGQNYSVNMPPSPTPAARGWSFEFPGSGHVDYVTYRTGPLEGASRIVVRYRVDAAPGTGFVAQDNPEAPATVSLYFQRGGDNWSGKRGFEHFRWYAPASAIRTLSPGVQEISVSLSDPGWTSVQGAPAGSNPDAFAAALAETDQVGVVFGSSARRGHGVFTTAPARFTLLSFDIR
ncbi:hypothetical protein ACFO0A_14250 [Novosphingobium tardum]|jgi:hypothetical protein|uniref:Uncharacterized protein n=1 Tax=Novosphingobium tardum TaxID=1538021 RepID=A0ABV8RSC9_9SPHN